MTSASSTTSPAPPRPASHEVDAAFARVIVDLRRTTFPMSRRAESAMSSQWAIAEATTTDILEAYLNHRGDLDESEQTARDPRYLHRLQRITANAVSRASHIPHSIDEVVTVLLARPGDALSLARGVLGRAQLSRTAHRSVAPGLVTREIHDAAILTGDVRRTSYLMSRLALQRSLSPDQIRLSHAMVTNWTGTLPSLLETVRQLAPTR